MHLWIWNKYFRQGVDFNFCDFSQFYRRTLFDRHRLNLFRASTEKAPETQGRNLKSVLSVARGKNNIFVTFGTRQQGMKAKYEQD